MRRHGQRSDAVGNRELLLTAVGRLLARDGEVTLGELATESGVSRATTYRNFSSPDNAVLAYIEEFLDAFETAAADAVSLDELSVLWGELVAEHGPALIHVRSSEGFLARAAANDPVIARIDRLIRRVAADDPLVAEHDRDLTVFLWNAVLDPRELLDLARHRGAPVVEVARLLNGAVTTAVAATPPPAR